MLRVEGSDELRSTSRPSPNYKSYIESDWDSQRWCIQCIQSLLMWLKVCTASQFSPLFEQSFAPIPKWLAIWVEDAIQTHGHTSDGQRRHLRWEGRAWIKCSRRGKKHFPGKASYNLLHKPSNSSGYQDCAFGQAAAKCKKKGSIMSQPASMKNGFPTGHVSCDLLERAIPAFLLKTGSNFKHEIQKLRRFPDTRAHFLNCFVVKAVSNRQSK